MTQITLKGNPINTAGDLPKVGDAAPDFGLTKGDLSEASLKDFSGKKVILNIFPSVDTPVCNLSMKAFNEKAQGLDDVVVLCISKDLPFAQGRICAAEGIENVVSLSSFRETSFGNDYGVALVDGPLAGLFARAVVVLDEQANVVYTELVPEIAQEPNYDQALAAVS